MQIAKDARRLLAAPRPTTCARRSARRTARRWRSSSPSSSPAAARRARATRVIEQLWATNEKSADYSFNKSPRGLLCADRLPHGLAEGQLPRRVHGRADLARSWRRRTRSRSSRRRPSRWGSRSCRRTSTSPTTTSSSSRATSASAWMPSRASATRRSRRSRPRARRAARSARCGTSARASTPARSTRSRSRRSSSAGRSARPARRARACSSVLEQAQAAGQKTQQDLEIGQGSIFDLRLRRRAARHRRRGGVRGARAPADPDRGVRPARAAGDREGVDRPVHLRAPAQAGARGAARSASTARSPDLPSARTRTGSRGRDHHARRRRSAHAAATT